MNANNAPCSRRDIFSMMFNDLSSAAGSLASGLLETGLHWSDAVSFKRSAR